MRKAILADAREKGKDVLKKRRLEATVKSKSSSAENHTPIKGITQQQNEYSTKALVYLVVVVAIILDRVHVL